MKTSNRTTLKQSKRAAAFKAKRAAGFALPATAAFATVPFAGLALAAQLFSDWKRSFQAWFEDARRGRK